MKRRREAVSWEMSHSLLVTQDSFLFSKHFHSHFVSCRGRVHGVFNNLVSSILCLLEATAQNSAGLNYVSFL